MILYENEIIILIDNEFVLVTFQPVKSYLKIQWKENVKYLLTNEALEISKKVFKKIQELGPKYILQDVSKVKFNYTQEYIDWVVNELVPRLPELGVKKIAYVISQDIITKVGLELIHSLAQKKANSVRRKIASTVKQAEMWLFHESE